jgi:hypothetical protein
MDICRRERPPSVVVSAGHAAACWLHVDPTNRRVQETGEPGQQGAAGSGPRAAAAAESNNQHREEN